MIKINRSKMDIAEKDIRDFYKSHSAEELRAEIAKDDRRRCESYSTIRQKFQQDQIEERIVVLREMLEGLLKG